MNRIIDARGDVCPIPVVKASQALSDMTDGTLEVHVDNEIAVQNLQRLAQQKKLSFVAEKIADGDWAARLIFAGGTPAAAGAASGASCPACAPESADWVVAVDTDRMGRGDDALGRTLMKSFLYALSQLPQKPRTLLFYNGGAHLTTEGSDSLEDLRAMAAQGVEIFTCGTCLNFYGLTDKLAVGEVSNMYSIVEKLAAAGKVVKP